MRYAYPCSISLDEAEARATGREAWVVTFPDLRGANTGGWSWAEAVEMAEDCLSVALGMYMKASEDIPEPSAPEGEQVVVPVPTVVAAKLALYSAMREEGVTKAALATRLGLSANAVRRLLDPARRSRISSLDPALKALGRSLIVENAATVVPSGTAGVTTS